MAEDKFQRKINYLRVSVTDRCNLRCFYCMPKEGVKWKKAQEILRYEEIEKIIAAALQVGISKVRITGGEPLVRKNLLPFIGRIAKLEGLRDLSMTTNGLLLADQAQALKEAGLKRVNISLDTLNHEAFKEITGFDKLEAVLAGIDKALEVGLTPLKINMVLMRNINEEDALELAFWTKEKPVHVRFIELMPMGALGKDRFLSIKTLKKRIASRENLIPAPGPSGSGPADYYNFPGALGTIGFISPLSNHFCHACNRLRLTADGRLRPCLMSALEVDIKEKVRAGASLEELVEIFRQVIELKPQGHNLEKEEYKGKRKMSQIGG